MSVPATNRDLSFDVGSSTNQERSAVERFRSKSFASYSTAIAVILDCFSITAGTFAGLAIYNLFGGVQVAEEPLKLFAFAAQYAVGFMLFGRLHSLYTHDHSLLQVRATASILRISTYSMLLVSVESFFSKLVVPRLLVLIVWLAVTLLLLFQKSSTRKFLARLRVNKEGQGSVLIVGTGSEARRIFSYLLHSPDLQLRPIAFFDECSSSNATVVYSNDYKFRDHAPVYHTDLDLELLRKLRITDIFVVEPNLSPQKISELVALSSEHSVRLSFLASSQPLFSSSKGNFRIMDGLFVSSFAQHTSANPGYELVKRLLDSAIAVCLLIASLPVWFVAAAWVRLSSSGPVFFRQERIGRHGRPFYMYKFRSMYSNSPVFARSPEHTNDPRITSVGRFLRKTSLDELPQLLNVIRGEMSLVGPRPEMPYVVSEYSTHQRQRLSVPQGLTGIWQLSADRKFAIHKSLEYDLYYIENRGLFLDLAILIHTAVFAAKGI